MVNVLPFSFEQCFPTFTMLLVEETSETGLSRHSSNHIFGVSKFKNTSTVRVIFFLKMFKIESIFS